MTLGPSDRLLRALGRALLPRPWLAPRLAGAPRRNDRGDTLDPSIQAMLKLQGVAGPALGDPSPEAARQDMRRGCALASAPARPVTTRDGTVAGPRGPLAVRRYQPAGLDLPHLVYFHGGGWAVGDLDTVDPFCRRLALDAELVVISVDYALAPEHPFPAGVRDAHAAVEAIEAEVGRPVGVGGDSAGGHLAALVAQEREVAWQLLIYPATDLRRLTASHQTLSRGFMLEKEAIDRYLDWLGADPEDPEASPALRPAPATPAVVATAGFDPLRDEGEDYVRALQQAGAEVVDLRFPSLVHGFVHLDGLAPRADEAVRQITDAARHVARTRDTV